jgi:hypothetical protein
MYPAPGYSTSDFLLAYDSQVSDHGKPANVHSDQGSQLVAFLSLLWRVSKILCKTKKMHYGEVHFA